MAVPNKRPRMSFYLDPELQQEIRQAALVHRLTLGDMAEGAFRRELARLAKSPPALPKGLRRGRPIKRK